MPDGFPELPEGSRSGGQLAANIVYFARILRAAGLPVGTGMVIDAIRAAEAVRPDVQADFFWALHAVFVQRYEHRLLFEQAFHVFWRNPRLLERLFALRLPELEQRQREDAEPELSKRLLDALNQDGAAERRPAGNEAEAEQDATLTWSAREVLQTLDFDKMSLQELADAKLMLRDLRWHAQEVATRRYRPSQQGQLMDLRASLRDALKTGGGLLPLRRKRRRTRQPPLVLICDISGSMSRYTRMFLHFAHALSNDRDRVFTFVFGTRLSNVTRQLARKDVDEALDRVTQSVQDWSGGTCIGRCLHAFNRDWSRRVLAQGAIVLFVSDGLDRDNTSQLALEIQRLHKSCRRLIWLNPLLRYDAFQPKAQGIRTILPHVDEFRPVHNLQSLMDLSAVLAGT